MLSYVVLGVQANVCHTCFGSYYVVLCCPMASYVALRRPMLSYVVLCCLMLSYALNQLLTTRVLSCCMLFYVALCCLMLSYGVLSSQTIVGHTYSVLS